MCDKLDLLRKTVNMCTKCDLSISRTNAVPGAGNPRAEVIFIGEAPGRNEDIKGSPFVGSAGRILNDAMDYAGFVREDVYITNVVKCRPPNNRRPNPLEASSCQPYLQEELGIIQPRVICILGNTAYGSLLGGSAITKNRGRLIGRDGRLYFVTVHPAAVIYNPDLASVLKEDLKTLHGILDKIKKGTQVQFDE